jgi:hypothetical protein
MAPSLAVLGRAGPYEMAAYVLVAVATCSINLYEVKRFVPLAYEPVIPTPGLSLALDQWIGAGLAIVILIAANAWEAHMVVTI